MAVPYIPDHPEITYLDIYTLPPCKFSEKADSALEIATHLRRVLETYGNGEPLSLRLPSTMALSGFYHRSILDVLDGLFELKRQHYDYMMNGLDAESILHDPLARKKGGKRPGRNTASEEFFKPWDAVMAYTRNSLDKKPPRKAV